MKIIKVWTDEWFKIYKLSKRTCESEDERMKRVFYEDCMMPCCGADYYMRGPEGGVSLNIKCAMCGAKFNITPLIQEIERIN